MGHHDEHGGLGRDLERLAQLRPTRRRMLRLLAGASVIPIVGCNTAALTALDEGADGDGGTSDANATCSEIPTETGGPYPGDGSNGPNVLTQSGIVRGDIRSSLAGGTTASGVPLSVTLSLVDQSCRALAGYAIYAWHCDRSGLYSMYSAGVTGETYLRGVQETDASGRVAFTTIFPGCYSGRWPHIHFEIYASLASATVSGNAVHTSQLAMPPSACNVAYATSGYEASVGNLASISLATDNVFSDDAAVHQLPTMSGDASGYAASLLVGITL
jgi:protocatechuate 3,4-dioxygenase beta subunit